MTDRFTNDELRAHAESVSDGPDDYPMLECESCMEAWQRGYGSQPLHKSHGKKPRGAQRSPRTKAAVAREERQ